MTDDTLHTCGPGPCRADGEGLARRIVAIRAPRSRARTIDLHCHIVVPEVERLVAGHPEKEAEPRRTLAAMGAESVEHNQRQMLPEAGLRLTSLENRLADMDAMGVDVQVVSPSPAQYYYWADPDLARDVVRTCNERIAATCARHPDRLAGLGTVALQHGALAAEQLEHAVRELGLRGVEISSSAGGRDFDHDSFTPFWRRAEELGCVVFLHPFGTTLGERLNRYYLSNIIGQPLETTIALSHLIHGGVLDRHPGLRIVAAHGGGYLPYYVGRSNHARHVRPEAGRIERDPLEYLRRIWFDTVVYEPATLRQLIDLVGVSQVVAGTDYPFDMGSYRVHELIEAVPGLDAEARERILGRNASELLWPGAPGRD